MPPRIPEPPLILASSSPRRRELLAELGYEFEIVAPSEAAECGVCSGETPPELVARLACQKAADVAARRDRGTIIACDTVVECRGQVLGKPSGEDQAGSMLRVLRGSEHRVYSGLCLMTLAGGARRVRVATSVLAMDEISNAEIEEYLSTDAWVGKAGAFGYQDRLGWVHVVSGSESNVVGLPTELLEEMLAAL